MDFLKDSALLKIEDVLPFFPDFVLIDDFKDAVTASLRDYNAHLDDLKSQVPLFSPILCTIFVADTSLRPISLRALFNLLSFVDYSP